jgi:hypothetical protein
MAKKIFMVVDWGKCIGCEMIIKFFNNYELESYCIGSGL